MGSLEVLSPVQRQAADMWPVHPDIQEMSDAYAIATAEDYQMALAEARRRNAQVLGEVLMRDQVEVVTPSLEQAGGNSILDRLRLAAEGDIQAMEALRVDTATEISEMICKGGAVMEVTAAMSKDGELEQFGQTTYRRQKNTLAFFPDQSAQLRANTMAEGQNGFLIESLWRQGVLADKQVVEFSLILDNEDARALSDYGYYLKEMIGIIRLTSIAPDGTATIRSALVGGVDQEALPTLDTGDVVAQEILQHRAALASRFDVAVVRDMYRQMGVEGAERLGTTELLARPLVVPAGFDILDFVQQYDATVHRLTGRETFFGLTGLRDQYDDIDEATYRTHVATSRRRQADLQRTAQTVLHEVLARHHEVDDALAAGTLLREVAKRHAVNYVVRSSDTIDTGVFGAHAELFMRHAQHMYAQGDIEAANHSAERAQSVARETGCPTGGGRKKAAQPVAATKSQDKDTKKPDDEPESLEGKPEKMRWIKGVCRVDNCPSRPKTTMVGPCSVCWGCQKHFDGGRDPAAVYKRPKQTEYALAT